MLEDVVEFAYLLASVRAPTQQELKIAERIFAYNAGDIIRFACIDECEEERHNGEEYYRYVCKYRACVSKAPPSKISYSSQGSQ